MRHGLRAGRSSIASRANAPLVTGAAISIIGSVMIGEGLVAQGVVPSPVPIAGVIIAAIAAFIIVRTTRYALPAKAAA